MIVCCLLLLALLAACSHESKRDNPLDPELSWTAYAVQEPLAAYWVLRREGELARWDTTTRITDVGNTSFTDTSLAANTSYTEDGALPHEFGVFIRINT